MSTPRITKKELENIRLRDGSDLAKLAEDLGYRDVNFGQLQYPNGAFASSLLDFFEDNPGAMEAVVEWVMDNVDLPEDVTEKEFECPNCGDVTVTREDGNWDDPVECSDCGAEMEELEDDT